MNESDPQLQSDQPSSRGFLRRCLWTIPLGLLCGLIASSVVLALFEPKYKAIHYVTENRDYLIKKPSSGSSVSLADREKVLITSPMILDAVLSDPRLRDAPSLCNPETANENLEENLSVESGDTRWTMAISYTDSDRQAAADVCNTVVSDYLRRREDFDNRRYRRLEQWLELQIGRLRRGVEAQSEHVARLTREATGYTSTEVGQNAIQLDLEFSKDLRTRILDTDIELAILENRAGKESQEDVDRSDSASENVPRAASLNDEETRRLKIQLAVLNEQYKSTMERLTDANLMSFELEFARNELSLSRETLRKLQERLNTISVESRRGSSVMSLFEAVPPSEPVESIPYTHIALAGLIGFMVPQLLSLLLSLAAIGAGPTRHAA